MNSIRRSALLSAIVLLSASVSADEKAPCTLKVYASTTLELHSGLEELYGLERKPGRGWATFTCINPVSLSSHKMSGLELQVIQRGAVQDPSLKEWYDVNRIYYVTSFDYISGEPLMLSFSARETETNAKVEYGREYRLFDR